MPAFGIVMYTSNQLLVVHTGEDEVRGPIDFSPSTHECCNGGSVGYQHMPVLAYLPQFFLAPKFLPTPECRSLGTQKEPFYFKATCLQNKAITHLHSGMAKGNRSKETHAY